jgi:energy-coupling factor transporter ATP-binding protein EcfA2
MASVAASVARVTDLAVLAADGRTLVGGVTFDVRLPARVAVMGANGAGKSVLLAALARVAEHRGAIDVPEPVAAILQDAESVFATASVEEEIAFAASCRGVAPATARSRVEVALATFGLDGHRRRDPATLSGGEQQRVQLAAAIATAPRTLLLDEPTEFLDAAQREDVEAHLERLNPAPLLTVLATHDAERALACDRLLVLRGGRAVAFGPPADVLSQNLSELDAWGIAVPPLVIACVLAAAGVLAPPLPICWRELEARVPPPSAP